MRHDASLTVLLCEEHIQRAIEVLQEDLSANDLKPRDYRERGSQHGADHGVACVDEPDDARSDAEGGAANAAGES